MARSYLLIISEREALAWVLRTSRMAFPATKRPEVDLLNPGDELFVVTTRGCFHNPSRDRTRVVARALVASDVTTLPEPLTLAGRDFTRGCDLTITAVAPYLHGAELAPMIERLEAFPNKNAWSIWLRRALLGLSESDALIVREALRDVAGTLEAEKESYLTNIKPVASVRRT